MDAPSVFDDRNPGNQVIVTNLPKVMKSADKETRVVYWKIIDHMFQFIRKTQANHAITAFPEFDYPSASMYAETIDAGDPIHALVLNNGMFTVGTYNYMVLMAGADSLESSMASLGQIREIIGSLEALSTTTAYPLAQGQFKSPIPSELDWLAAKKWYEKKYHRELAEEVGQQALAKGCHDIPQDPKQLHEKAQELSNVALNEVGIIDRMWHGKGKEKRLNFVIKRKRGMSVLELALVGWDAVIAVRDCQMGIPKVPMLAKDFAYRTYESFKARLAHVNELFRTSKAAVTNTLATPSVIKSAGQPYKAMKIKMDNKKTNAKRDDEMLVGRGVLAQQKSAATPATEEATEQNSDSEGESSDDQDEDANSEEESVGDEDPSPGDEDDSGNDQGQAHIEVDQYQFDAKWDLIVQHLAAHGEGQPVSYDIDGRIAYTSRVLELMEDSAFMETLLRASVFGGVDDDNQKEEDIYGAWG